MVDKVYFVVDIVEDTEADIEDIEVDIGEAYFEEGIEGIEVDIEVGIEEDIVMSLEVVDIEVDKLGDYLEHIQKVDTVEEQGIEEEEDTLDHS